MNHPYLVILLAFTLAGAIGLPLFGGSNYGNSAGSMGSLVLGMVAGGLGGLCIGLFLIGFISQVTS
jgi:hypothetical protein